MKHINHEYPTKEHILSWIKVICDKGFRRPGSEEDHKVEKFLIHKLREFGLRDIRKEDIKLTLWEPKYWKLTIELNNKKTEIPAFYIVYTEFTKPEGISGELIYLKSGRDIDFKKNDVSGKIALIDFRNPPLVINPLLEYALYVHDTKKTIPEDYSYPATFMLVNWDSFYRAYENGAAGVIGILKDHPGGYNEYYYPSDYTATDPRPIPGLYIGRDDGKKLKRIIRENKVETIKSRMILTGSRSPGITSNILGFIPGKTEDLIILSSHHDAPFNNAVQDASGIGVILALAKYFAQFPKQTFNKSLLFLFTAGHFYEKIGGDAFIKKHQKDLLPKVFTSIHIEHVGDEYLEKDKRLVPTGYPAPRAFFVSNKKPLVSLVKNSVIKHDLQRSLILPTDNPLGVATDGRYFHEKVNLPIISMASAPVYLYNPIDTIEKLAIEEFEPITKAFINIVKSLDNLSRKEIGLKE